MKKTIYILLLLITLGFIGYTGYYITTQKPEAPIVAAIATTTPVVEKVSDKNRLTTKSGGSITVGETNPSGESLSTITLTTTGFASNRELHLERNKLTSFFLLDMNKDGFDELVLVSTAQGSGSYGEIDIYTTASNTGLVAVDVFKPDEDNVKKGGVFEGYMGHDMVTSKDGMLIREYPIYSATSTNTTPTGQTKRLIYALTQRNGVYVALASTEQPALTKPNATSTPTSTSSGLISTGSTTPPR